MYQQYGPIVREKIGGKYIVHVFDPEDIKTVYSVEGKKLLFVRWQEFKQEICRKSKLEMPLI